MAKKQKLSELIGTGKCFLLNSRKNPTFEDELLFDIPYYRPGYTGDSQSGWCGSLSTRKDKFSTEERKKMSLRLEAVCNQYIKGMNKFVEEQLQNPNLQVFKFLWNNMSKPFNLTPILKDKSKFSGKNIVAYSCSPVNVNIFPVVSKHKGFIDSSHPFKEEEFPLLMKRAIKIVNAVSREYYDEVDTRTVWYDSSKSHQKFDEILEKEIEKKGGRSNLKGGESSEMYNKFYHFPKKKEDIKTMREVAFNLSQPVDYIGFRDFLPTVEECYGSENRPKNLIKKLEQSHIILPKFVKFARNWDPTNAYMPSQETGLIVDFDKLLGLEGFNDYTLSKNKK
jgi:hypothetical protein